IQILILPCKKLNPKKLITVTAEKLVAKQKHALAEKIIQNVQR
ncbi:3523_t:CDS:1, partial [Gigaspora margarita]